MEREKERKFVRKSKVESYLDEQVDWLADAEWFASSGLSASAAQTLYPRHSSSVFSPLRCLLFATPIPLPTLLSHDSLFLARSSSSFRKSLKAFRSYPRRSFVAASRGFPPLVRTLQLFSKFTPFHADYSKNSTRIIISPREEFARLLPNIQTSQFLVRSLFRKQYASPGQTTTKYTVIPHRNETKLLELIISRCHCTVYNRSSIVPHDFLSRFALNRFVQRTRSQASDELLR